MTTTQTNTQRQIGGKYKVVTLSQPDDRIKIEAIELSPDQQKLFQHVKLPGIDTRIDTRVERAPRKSA